MKPVEKINKNQQRFLEISPVQKEAFPSNKLQGHAYEKQNPFSLKEDNQLIQAILSRTDQKYKESLIQEKIHIQENSNKELEYWKSYVL